MKSMVLGILDRYITRELVKTFALSLVTLTFVIMMHQIMLLVDLIVSKGVGLFTILRLFLYSLPISLEITVPTSALVASLAVYGRMSADHEVVALKAAGVNPFRLQAPAIAFGLAASALSLYVTLDAMPHGTRAFRDLAFDVARKRAMSGLREGTFNAEFDGLTLYFQRQEADGSLENVFIEDRRDAAAPRVVVARKGHIAVDPENVRLRLMLRAGTIHSVVANQPGLYRVVSFNEFDMRLDLGRSLAPGGSRGRWGMELTVPELRQQAAMQRGKGLRDAGILVEIQRRFATPSCGLFFVVLGSALGLRTRKASRNTSLLLAVVIGLGYYLILTAGRTLGEKEYLPPVWAMWLPNVLLGATAGWFALLGVREGQPRMVFGFGVGRALPVR
jgi:lipopolysaccharide export system permease protein